MNVNFYTFKKKANSTKQPTGDGTTFDCYLLDNTDVLSPVIVLDVADSPISFNYAYIPDFNRYYFIQNWQTVRGLWHCSMSVDVMASYKTEIGNATQYVLRSEAEFDGNIVDNLYPQTTDVEYFYTPVKGYTITGGEIDYVWDSSIEEGCYVLGIIGRSTREEVIGSVYYQALKPTEMTKLISILYGNTTWIGDIGSQVNVNYLKTEFEPIKYIKSCRWYPFDISVLKTYGSTKDYFSFGWWSFNGIECEHLSKSIYNFPTGQKGQPYYFAIDFPEHPQSNRGKYLNFEPYTETVISFPPFADFTLSESVINKFGRSIAFNMGIDITTGEIALQVEKRFNWGIDVPGDTIPIGDTSDLITPIISKIGIDCPIAQMSTATISDFLSSLGTTASAVVAPTASNIGGAIGSLFDLMKPEVSSVGQVGSGLLTLYNSPIARTRCIKITDENTYRFGRPLAKNRAIRNLPGYNMCANPTVTINGFESEQREILGYMSSGFYYE